VLDLFQPPKPPVPTNVRRVLLADMDAPIGEDERRRQRLEALRIAWAARSKTGKVYLNSTREEKLARRRIADQITRQDRRGSPEHEAEKAAKLARYHAMTPEQKEALRAKKREWYARRKQRA
jgi:hypothetical protein